MVGSETRQVLGGDEGEVHAGLEQKAFRLPELVAVEALGVTMEVADLLWVLTNENECRMERQKTTCLPGVF